MVDQLDIICQTDISVIANRITSDSWLPAKKPASSSPANTFSTREAAISSSSRPRTGGLPEYPPPPAVPLQRAVPNGRRRGAPLSPSPRTPDRGEPPLPPPSGGGETALRRPAVRLSKTARLPQTGGRGPGRPDKMASHPRPRPPGDCGSETDILYYTGHKWLLSVWSIHYLYNSKIKV